MALGGEERIFKKKNQPVFVLGAIHYMKPSLPLGKASLKSTFVHDGKLVHGGGCVFSKAHFIKTLQEDRHNNACKATGREAQRQTQYNCGLGVCAIGQHGRRSVWVVWCGVRVCCCVVGCWFFFFLILCNDAPKATVDGGAERSWGRGVRGWGWLCCRGADLMHI